MKVFIGVAVLYCLLAAVSAAPGPLTKEEAVRIAALIVNEVRTAQGGPETREQNIRQRGDAHAKQSVYYEDYKDANYGQLQQGEARAAQYHHSLYPQQGKARAKQGEAREQYYFGNQSRKVNAEYHHSLYQQGKAHAKQGEAREQYNQSRKVYQQGEACAKQGEAREQYNQSRKAYQQGEAREQYNQSRKVYQQGEARAKQGEAREQYSQSRKVYQQGEARGEKYYNYYDDKQQGEINAEYHHGGPYQRGEADAEYRHHSREPSLYQRGEATDAAYDPYQRGEANAAYDPYQRGEIHAKLYEIFQKIMAAAANNKE